MRSRSVSDWRLDAAAEVSRFAVQTCPRLLRGCGQPPVLLLAWNIVGVLIVWARCQCQYVFYNVMVCIPPCNEECASPRGRGKRRCGARAEAEGTARALALYASSFTHSPLIRVRGRGPAFAARCCAELPLRGLSAGALPGYQRGIGRFSYGGLDA